MIYGIFNSHLKLRNQLSEASFGTSAQLYRNYFNRVVPHGIIDCGMCPVDGPIGKYPHGYKPRPFQDFF